MSAQTLPLQLNCFNHVLDLSLIDFPPPEPERDHQWLRVSEMWKGSDKPNLQIKVDCWKVMIPGRGPVFLFKEERALTLHRYLTSHLKAASYLGEFDGDLYDWRDPVGGKVLRTGYMGIHAKIANGQQLKATLRAIPNEPYQASMFFETYEGYCLCPDCVRGELPSVVSSIRNRERDMWHVTGFDTLWEGDVVTPATCDNCNRLIEPVYGAACHERA